MTFEELMASRQGVWIGDAALVVGPDTYLWTVARGSPTAYEITKDGYKLMGEQPATKVEPSATVSKVTRRQKFSAVPKSVDE